MLDAGLTQLSSADPRMLVKSSEGDRRDKRTLGERGQEELSKGQYEGQLLIALISTKYTVRMGALASEPLWVGGCNAGWRRGNVEGEQSISIEIIPSTAPSPHSFRRSGSRQVIGFRSTDSISSLRVKMNKITMAQIQHGC